MCLPTAKRLNLVAVGTAHGKNRRNAADPVRVEQIVRIRPFQGRYLWVVADPWAVPTAIEFVRYADADSFAFTVSLTIFPSALFPASLAIAAFITPPMSFIDDAPVSAIAAATAWSISSCEADCGK